MPKEMRKIILSTEELVEALDSYKRTNFEFLHAGKIAPCEVKANAPVFVGIKSAGENTMKTIQFALRATDLLEPLIKYCIENNIMLPRNSRKSVLLGDDQAVLFIQINTTADTI
jgi:hypothetical protein